LQAQGLDVDAATEQEIFIQLDVAETLSTFMVNVMPDTTRFFEVAAGLIESTAKAARQEHYGVVVCGECSPTLWAEGKADAAIRVEQLFNRVGKPLGWTSSVGTPSAAFTANKTSTLSKEHSAVYSH
jgi:hypothetical protein